MGDEREPAGRSGQRDDGLELEQRVARLERELEALRRQIGTVSIAQSSPNPGAETRTPPPPMPIAPPLRPVSTLPYRAAIPLQQPTSSRDSLENRLGSQIFNRIYGAALLAVGFWKRAGFLRWQALLLLVFTIFKAFLYDMRNLSQGYRVVSFLGLGALLMAISFAYQKDWLNLREAQRTESLAGDSEAVR